MATDSRPVFIYPTFSTTLPVSMSSCIGWDAPSNTFLGYESENRLCNHIAIQIETFLQI